MPASPDELRASVLLKRWRSQIGPRLLQPDIPPRRGLALGYMLNGPVAENLVCIEDLVLTVLYDEPIANGMIRSRLAGYSGRTIAWGVCWGGRSRNKFDKDLGMPPERCAHGPRIELTRVRLLEHGLELDQLVDQATNSIDPQSSLRLPTLWAAFRPAEARCAKPSGPEFEALRQRLAISSSELLGSYRRRYLGLVLLPIEWVSHCWQQWSTVFADLSQYPRHQCLRLFDADQQLQGFTGAVRYDLVASRFNNRRMPSRNGMEPRQLSAASA
jgi:hypothetical protein